MDQESLRALDDVEPGDEVEVLYEYRVLEGDDLDQDAWLTGEFRGVQSAHRVASDDSLEPLHSHVEIAMVDEIGSHSYFIPFRDIRRFRIRRRAEVKHDG